MARQKGSQNRNKVALLKKLQDMYGSEFDPVMRMAEQATRIHAAAIDAEDGTKALIDSVNAWDKVAQYIQPKLKAVELSGGLDLVAHEKALDELE